GRRQAIRDRLDDLLANRDLLAVLEVVVWRHTDLAQHPLELGAVEAAVGGAEGRVLCRQRSKAVTRQAKTHLASLLVEHGASNELRQHLIVDAEGLRLLTGQRRAELLRELTDLTVIGEAVFEDRDPGLAD